MKKSLVLAMAMALGVTASAYAANPFSDVPAGHWAYDSISKLAAAGVVEGYPDGTFKGENLMTRYEMAQIVAKAMAKGANVDALAAEFADELDNLGVRVAALEKKADNVKITGQIRYHYAKTKNVYTDGGKTGSDDNLRSRIWIAGQINEDWKYTGMIENNEKFDKNDGKSEGIAFQRAYLNGKIGGLKVTAGRYHYNAPLASAVLPFGSALYGNRIDGVTVKYGKGITIEGTAGKLTDSWNFNKFAMANVVIPFGKAIKANVAYYNINGLDYADIDEEIINVGLNVKAGKNITLVGDWMKVNSDSERLDGNDAWVAGIAYKGAKANKPGSYGLAVKYFDYGLGTSLRNGFNAYNAQKNMKLPFAGEGIAVGGYYTVAKNIVAGVEYYNLDEKPFGSSAEKIKNVETLWTQLIFSF